MTELEGLGETMEQVGIFVPELCSFWIRAFLPSFEYPVIFLSLHRFFSCGTVSFERPASVASEVVSMARNKRGIRLSTNKARSHHSAMFPAHVRKEIHGVATDIVIQAFSDRILVLVTQLGKVGNLVHAFSLDHLSFPLTSSLARYKSAYLKRPL